MIRGIVVVRPGKTLSMVSFSRVLGVVLELPNNTVVVFDDIAFGKDIDLAGIACVAKIFISLFIFNMSLIFC